MSRLLIIDGDNLLHRVYHKFKQLKSKDGKDSALIYGVPYLVSKLIKKFRPTEIHMPFDGGSSLYRRAILPQYRDRDHSLNMRFDPESFMAQKKDVMKYLPHFGIHCYWKRHYEADDIIYAIVRKKKAKNNIIIVSSDKDFNQMLQPKVSIWNPFKAARITHKSLYNIMGYYPEQTIDYLILDGDSSDMIPGYPGIGPVKAKAFLEEFSSIKNFLTGDYIHKTIKKELLAALFKQNNALINLRHYYVRDKAMRAIPGEFRTNSPKFNTLAIVHKAKSLDISYFTQSDFLKAFKTLK